MKTPTHMDGDQPYRHGTRRRRASLWRCHLGMTMAVAAWAAGAQPVPDLGQPWLVARPPLSPSANPAPDPHSALPSGAPLSLAALTDFALRNNPATRDAWEGAFIDRAGIDAARASWWPSVSASVPLTLNRGTGGATAASTSDAAATPSPTGGTTRTVDANLSLTWVLFEFGARDSSVAAARWQAAASELSYNRALQTVASNVEQAYYNELAALELVDALTLNVRAAQASLEAAQGLRRAGLATVGDTAQAQSALAQARLTLVRAQVSERSAAGTLAMALNLPVSTRLNLAREAAPGTPTGTQQAIVQRLPSVDALLSMARTSRADLAVLDARVLAAQAQAAEVEAQGRPSLAFSANAGRHWDSSASPQTSEQVALTLTIPIWDGGLIRAQTQAARAKVRQLAAQRDEQGLSVELEVWQSFQQADSAQEEIDAAADALHSAEVSEASARERYRVGMGTMLELMVAQANTAQARASKVQAHYDARLAMAKLGYALGSWLPLPTPDDIQGARP